MKILVKNAGPRGFPIVGYLPFIPKDKPIFKMLQDLAETYGNILGFYVGPSKPFISVVGPSAVKEALQNDDLNGRPSGAIIQTRTFGERLGNYLQVTINVTSFFN